MGARYLVELALFGTGMASWGGIRAARRWHAAVAFFHKQAQSIWTPHSKLTRYGSSPQCGGCCPGASKSVACCGVRSCRLVVMHGWLAGCATGRCPLVQEVDHGLFVQTQRVAAFGGVGGVCRGRHGGAGRRAHDVGAGHAPARAPGQRSPGGGDGAWHPGAFPRPGGQGQHARRRGQAARQRGCSYLAIQRRGVLLDQRHASQGGDASHPS